MKRKLPFLEAIAVLVGTIIGAGILGIPYVVAKAGFWTGLVVLLVITVAVIFVDLFLGEIVLSTKKRHQLTGYAEEYLGKPGKYLMFFSVIFSFYGALLAYIIGEGEVLAALAGGSPFIYSLLFFSFASLLVYLGLTVVKKFEFVMTLAVLLLVFIVAIRGLGFINLHNLGSFSWQKLFWPYGVIFFAMSGASAIPQLRDCLKGREKLIKTAIITGVFIPFFVYLIFMFLVVGIAGVKTTEVATIGLGQVMGRLMVIIGNLFAFFTMATSFLALGLALKDTYQLDLKLKHFWAWALACLVPLLIFIFGLRSFIKVIGTVGAIGGGLEGLLILVIYLKLKSLKVKQRTPEYRLKLLWPFLLIIGLIFIGGFIYTLVS